MKNILREKIRLTGKVVIKEWDINEINKVFGESFLKTLFESEILKRLHEASLKGLIKPVATRIIKNLIVTVGKQHVAELLAGIVSASFNYIRVGNSSQAPALGDTDIIGTQTLAKQVTDRFRTSNKAVFSTFAGSAEGNGIWAECVLATALSGGIILCRALFSTFVKDSSKTETVDWEITCG